MQRIRFRNGVDAPEILLEERFSDEKDAKSQLDEIVLQYGTVPDAAAWLDGDKPPKQFAEADAEAAPDPEAEPASPEEEPEATDAAAALADELGVDLSQVEGTGAEGRVTKADVEKAASK